MFYVNYHPRSGLILSVSQCKEQDALEITQEEYLDFMTNPGAITSYWVLVDQTTGQVTLVKQVQNNFSPNPSIFLKQSTTLHEDFVFYADIDSGEITLKVKNPLDVNRTDIRIHGMLNGDIWQEVQTVVFKPGVFTSTTKGEYSLESYVWYVERPLLDKTYGITYTK